MANQAWLDEVRERLAKHTLPPAYIRRFMDELSDHFQDITEENMGTEANVLSRLGEPEHVAESAATAYRRRSFLGRAADHGNEKQASQRQDGSTHFSTLPNLRKAVRLDGRAPNHALSVRSRWPARNLNSLTAQ